MAVGLKEQQGNVDRNDFYAELMKLRKHWRLKKSGDLILGDLSYKSGQQIFIFTPKIIFAAAINICCH